MPKHQTSMDLFPPTCGIGVGFGSTRVGVSEGNSVKVGAALGGVVNQLGDGVALIGNASHPAAWQAVKPGSKTASRKKHFRRAIWIFFPDYACSIPGFSSSFTQFSGFWAI